MPLEFLYADPGGSDGEAASTSLGSNTVRFGEMGLSQSAEVGNPSVSSLDIDDPDAVWNFVGLRRFVVKETSAPSNNRIIWGGVVQDRTVKRADSMLTGAARHWSLELSDYNGQLGKRILIDADSKRPAETAGDRIRWLLTDAAHVWLFDFGHVTYPSDQMDPHDYRGMRPLDVLSDCAVESGYTFWCELHEATSRPELFFLDPGGSAYTSDIAISNVYADFDGTTTFLPSQDAELRRSASRVTYGAYVAYSKGAVYVRNDAVGTNFAKVDQTAPMATVKTAAKARRIGNHFLADNDEEDDRITCWIDVPAAQVNDIRAGQRIPVKFTHFPGYETYRYVRVAHRTVYQMEEGGGYAGADNEEAYYRIRLELSPASDCAIPSGGTTLTSTSNLAYGKTVTTYNNTGEPTTPEKVVDGSTEADNFSWYGNGVFPGGTHYQGWIVDLGQDVLVTSIVAGLHGGDTLYIGYGSDADGSTGWTWQEIGEADEIPKGSNWTDMWPGAPNIVYEIKPIAAARYVGAKHEWTQGGLLFHTGIWCSEIAVRGSCP